MQNESPLLIQWLEPIKPTINSESKDQIVDSLLPYREQKHLVTHVLYIPHVHMFEKSLTYTHNM